MSADVRFVDGPVRGHTRDFMRCRASPFLSKGGAACLDPVNRDDLPVPTIELEEP